MRKKRKQNENVLRITDNAILRNDIKETIFELSTTFILVKKHETRKKLEREIYLIITKKYEDI